MATNAIGRPSSYTPALASEICERLVNEPLARICRDDHIPAIGTVLQWVEDNREGFSERYARARSIQIETMAHEIMTIADNLLEDPNSRRVRVDSRKWLLSRLRPKVYGDATMLKHADANGNQLEVQVTRVSPRPPKVIDVTPQSARLPLAAAADDGVARGTASEGAD
jgi:hypothetical protein